MERLQKDLRANTSANVRLTKAEEVKLATAAMNGDVKSRNLLIESNIPFAISEAKAFRRKTSTSLDLEELVSAASLALVKAADSFDPTYGVKFISYAVYKIKAELTEAHNERHVVHTPSAQKRRWSQSMDQAYDKEGTMFVSDTFESDTISADDQLDTNMQIDKLLTLTEQLDTRSKDILNAYYHLDYNFDIKPIDMITKYNLTGERIRGIKNNTIKNLNSQLC